MNVTLTIAAGALALLMGTSGLADGRDESQVRTDKDGVQLGASSVDPRQHGYEHAYRDGADRGAFDREHGVRYSVNARTHNDNARGYEPFMGNKRQYQLGYREGYKAGYDSAYLGVTVEHGRVRGDIRPVADVRAGSNLRTVRLS